MALCYLHNNKNIYFIFRYVDFVKLHSKSHYFIILCAIVLCLGLLCHLCGVWLGYSFTDISMHRELALHNGVNT